MLESFLIFSPTSPPWLLGMLDRNASPSILHTLWTSTSHDEATKHWNGQDFVLSCILDQQAQKGVHSVMN